MNRQILLFTLLALSAAFPTFDEYLVEFGKEYNDTEKLIRKPLYDARVAILEAIVDYEAGVNEFSDWTDSEIADLKGLLLRSSASNSKPVSSGKLGAPSSIDWRAKDKVSGVRNQGRCGSCWAFASVAYAESKLLIDDRYRSIDLAEQEVLECASSSDCNGGYLEEGMKELIDEVPFEALYPYSPGSSYRGICGAGGVQVGETVKNYYNLTDGELKELVAQRPVAIAVSAEGWENYGSGVYQCGPTDPINHAVLLVGYTSQYWIVKNSWGSGWGENGFMRISRSLLSNCRIGASAHVTFELRLGALLGLVAAILLISH